MKGDKLIKDELITMVKELLLDLPAFQFKDRRKQILDMLNNLSSDKKEKKKKDWSKVNFFEQVSMTWDNLSYPDRTMIIYSLLLTLTMVLVRLIILPGGHIILIIMFMLWFLIASIAFLRWYYRFTQIGSLLIFRDQINADVNSYVNSVETTTKGISGDLMYLSSRIAKGIIKQRIHNLELFPKTIKTFEISTAFVLTAATSLCLGSWLVNLVNSFLRYAGLLAKYSSSLEPEKVFPVLVCLLTFVIRDFMTRGSGLHIGKLQTSLDVLEIRDEANSKEEKTALPGMNIKSRGR
jgi:hypothetical protein